MNAVRIGLDLAKSVFQVHGVDAVGAVMVRRRLARSQLLPFFARLEPCLIGFEACSSAHHGARAGASGARRSIDPAAVREALCKEEQD
jgi:transposase